VMLFVKKDLTVSKTTIGKVTDLFTFALNAVLYLLSNSVCNRDNSVVLPEIV